VVIRLLEEVPQITRMLVMVQREVGERLAAAPGTRGCGPASVKVAYFAEARVVGTVPRTVFVPEPNVESALIRLDRRVHPPVDVQSPRRMFELARAGFGQRRKMLRRSLRPLLGADARASLEQAGIDPTARAESLDLRQWAALANQVAP
jgi:16S rRNA (adenine1518-N6/adenine1519-N6)-dimethyltransferase